MYYLERSDVGPLVHAERRGFSAVAGMRNHLMGLAAYAISIEPEYGRNLREGFGLASTLLSHLYI